MPKGVDYSKWDNLDDSDDDDDPNQQSQKGAQPLGEGKQTAGDPNEKRQATVKAGFIIRTIARGDGGRPLYINICSSPAVPGGPMTTTPEAMNSMQANMPYICGEIRQDVDMERGCLVIEFIFAPATLVAADTHKTAAEACIQCALAVIREKHARLDVDQNDWKLFAPDALQEANGAHFFAPGKLSSFGKLGVE